ncbi:MAG: hypothetical protein ACRD36_12365 [Candidatus Acidiferrum sp.]
MNKNDQREMFDIVCRSFGGRYHFNHLLIDNTSAFEQQHSIPDILQITGIHAARGGQAGESPGLAREPWALASGQCTAGYQATGAAVGVR